MTVRRAASRSAWHAAFQEVHPGCLTVALVSLMIVTTALANKEESPNGSLADATDRSQVFRKLVSPPTSSDNHTHTHNHHHHHHQSSALEWAQTKWLRHQEDNSHSNNQDDDHEDLKTEQSSPKWAETTMLKRPTNVPETRTTTRQLVEAKPVRFHHQMPDAPADGSKQLHDDHITQDTQPTLIESHHSRATSEQFHPKYSNSTAQHRLRRSSADGSANMVAPSAILNQQQQIIHSPTSQTLVVPCRNYTLASMVGADPARRASAAGASPRVASKQAAGPAPFHLTVPQISGISLIVWHKDEQMNAPIFAADARGVSSVRDARQQVSSDALRGRARLELVELHTNRILAPGSLGASQALPALVIEDAGTQDAGLYTCTVEFHKAPTQVYQTRVAVIDPPKNMVIRDESNGGEARQLYSSLVGPFDEDAHLLLVCRAEPGKPAVGQISWWQLDSVTPLSADLLHRSGPPSTRSKGSTATAAALLQQLDAKSKHLLTLNFDDDPEDASAMADTTTMGSLEGDIGGGPSDKGVDAALMQSADLFLGALSGEFDLQQLVPQLPRVLFNSNQQHRQRHLRHWRRVENKTIVPQSSDGDGKLEAHLELSQLSRSNIGDEYLCLASSEAQFAPPLNASIRLNLNLKPLSVHIESKTNGTFRLGQKAMVECHALGSKPSASIKWFKGGRELEPTSANSRPQSGPKTPPPGDSLAAQDNLISEFNRDINKLTKVSYLTFMPQPSDDQQQLSCSAQNPRIPQAPTLSDSLLMNVQSPPRLALKFGTNIRPDAIHLSSDIFMDCNIDANPPISELLWMHNGEPLAPNISAGVIMSNQSLVLRHIRIEQRGVYQCLAHNALGQTLSNKLELRPKFAPICDQTLTRARYELALNQRARIECHVLAEPGEDLHFSWRFNNSAGHSSGPAPSSPPTDDSSAGDNEQLHHYETNFTRSSLTFTPRSRRDFGQLLCSATNSMGRQERPCVIMLVQSELPEPLLGCFIDNQTHSSFSIHCQPPALGATSSSSRAGQTYFILELFANETFQQQQQQQEAATSSTQDRRQRQQHLTSSHLNLRQPADNESRNLQAEESSMQDEDYSASSARASDGVGEEIAPLEKHRVKRLLSETPSFNVANLEPNSSYNVLVYVQNSRGRSPATHHQVSTRPMDGSALASGHVEFLGKNDAGAPGGGELSFGGKVLSFLALGSHFRNSDGSVSWVPSSKRPLASVALIVLLATLSLLTLVAFTSRVLCRRSKRTTRVAPRTCRTNSLQEKQNVDHDDNDDQAAASNDKRKSSSSSELRGFVRPAVRERIIDGATAGSSINSGRPLVSSTSSHSTTMSRATTECKQLGRQPAMRIAATNTLNVNNQHGCTHGSGSETSRETNTDSTFISSPQTGTESSCQSVQTYRLMHRQAQLCNNNYNSMQRQRPCSRGDLNNSMQANVYSSGSLQKAKGHFQPAVAAYSMVKKRPMSHHQATPANNRQMVARHFDQTENPCTPQISVHSGSDCWTSNSPDANLDQHSFGAVNGGGGGGGALMQDGIYVINTGQPADHSVACPAMDEQETTSSFWFGHAIQRPDSLNRCHLVDSEVSAELPLGVQQQGHNFNAHAMPNSLSIPISLSDRLQVINSRPNSMNTHRLSQDNLPSTMLLGSNGQSYGTQPQTGSYLTLAPSFVNHHHHSLNEGADELCETPLSIMDPTGCLDQQQQQQQLELTPPVDFANDYRRFKQTFGIENVQQQQQQLQQENQRQIQKHRVKFETSNNEAQQIARQEM